MCVGTRLTAKGIDRSIENKRVKREGDALLLL